MKKLLLLSAFCLFPSVNAIKISYYDSIDHEIETLLEKWNIDTHTFIKQDGCGARMVIFKESDDDDEKVAVGIFSIKSPNILAACCGVTKKAYIEALAVAPNSRRKGAATSVVMEIFKELRDTPDIDHVYTLIPRNNATAEKFYIQMGFTEEPTPAWAPKKLTYSFSKKQN